MSDEGDFSIAQMKADYEAMILAAKLKALEARPMHTSFSPLLYMY